jgi:hypothetical protein
MNLPVSQNAQLATMENLAQIRITEGAKVYPEKNIFVEIQTHCRRLSTTFFSNLHPILVLVETNSESSREAIFLEFKLTAEMTAGLLNKEYAIFH